MAAVSSEARLHESAVQRSMSPLRGKRIVITRAAHQSSDFAAKLADRGAIPLLYPCIRIAPLEDHAPLARALENWASGVYRWVIFTSANAVEIVASSAPFRALQPPDGSARFAAVGEITARAVQRYFNIPAVFPAGAYRAAALANLIAPAAGEPILLFQPEQPSAHLAEALQERGAQVDSIAVYRTIPGGEGGVDLAALLADRKVDAITFASPSAVRGFRHRVGVPAALPPVACIGESTAAAACELGFSVAAVAHVSTLDHLIASLEDYFSGE